MILAFRDYPFATASSFGFLECAKLCFEYELFASLNPKLFEELKNPPTQYNLYLEGENLNIIDICNHSFVYPIINGHHQMIEQNIQLAQNPLNNQLYTLHTNHLALQKLDEQKIPTLPKFVMK